MELSKNIWGEKNALKKYLNIKDEYLLIKKIKSQQLASKKKKKIPLPTVEKM